MKTIILLLLLTINFAFSQNNSKPIHTVQDLSFLIGTWEITFEFFDPHKPERGKVFEEKGTQVCKYDLSLDGTPMYITCIGEVTSSRGRTRTFQESIRYSKFTNSYIRVGLFSNWSATSLEQLTYDTIQSTINIQGELPYPAGSTEKYKDTYKFNTDHTFYEREHVANYPDMPSTLFNLALKGTGRKK